MRSRILIPLVFESHQNPVNHFPTFTQTTTVLNLIDQLIRNLLFDPLDIYFEYLPASGYHNFYVVGMSDFLGIFKYFVSLRALVHEE